MSIFKSTSAVACVILITGGTTWAAPSNSVSPQAYHDQLLTKFIKSGYRSVRMVDAASNRLVAYDRDGSEVMLVAHPWNFTLTSSTYVHPIDD